MAMQKLMMYLMFVNHVPPFVVPGAGGNVEQSLSGFATFHTSFPSTEHIRDELTTVFAASLFDSLWPTQPLILVVDGSYMYMNVPTTSAFDNQANYSGQKKRYLRKTMTVVTTSGHLVYSNDTFDGKASDTVIMKKLIEAPEQHGAGDLVNCLEQNEVLLILDRGLS